MDKYNGYRVQEVANEFAIIEPSDQFGAGNLAYYYGIRSNTSSVGFLKVIQFAKPKKKKDFYNYVEPTQTNNISLPSAIIKKKEYSGQGSSSSIIGNTSNGSFKSPTLKIQVISPQAVVQNYGKNNNGYDSQTSSNANNCSLYIPLIMPSFLSLAQSDIALYLKSIGKMIVPLQVIGSFLSFVGNQILYDIQAKYNKRVFYPGHKAKSIQINDDGTFTTTIEKNSFDIVKEDKSVKIIPKTTIVRMHSNSLVLATGGKQKIPSTFIKKYDIITQQTRKGGSHSAFSIAWLLLNGPCALKQFYSTTAQTLSHCQNCASCPLGLTHTNQQQCICQQSCKCVSLPKLPNPSTNEISDTKFPCISKNGSVKILYRDKIKVYYSTTAIAQADQYFEYDPKQDVSKGGIVFPFTGLRGDAKELWRKIKKGHEDKVELVKADSIIEQKMYTKNADVVIFACGYQSNHIPIYNSSGEKIAFKKINSNKSSTYEVDQNCRLISLGSKQINGLYGIGIGYSLKTSDNLVQAEQKNTAKADSVGLYVKQIGHKILNAVLHNRPNTSQKGKEPLKTQQLIINPSSSSQIRQNSYFITKTPLLITPSKIQPQVSNFQKQQISEAYYNQMSSEKSHRNINDSQKQQIASNCGMSGQKRASFSAIQSSQGGRTSTAGFFNTRGQQNFQNLMNEQVQVSKKTNLANSLKQNPFGVNYLDNHSNLMSEQINRFDLNYWKHKSPEIKKTKMLMIGNNNNYEHKNQSLSSTLTQPLSKGMISSSNGPHKKNESGGIYRTPLREKVKNIQRPQQFNGNHSLTRK